MCAGSGMEQAAAAAAAAQRTAAQRGRRRPGSVLSSKINYLQDERAFEPGDIRPEALQAKKEVLLSTQGDGLAFSRPHWDSTSGAGASALPQRALMRQNSRFQPFPLRMNFRAEVLPRDDTPVLERQSKLKFDESALLPKALRRTASPLKARMTQREIAVHPALEGKTEWDVTTSADADLNGTALAHTDEHWRRLQPVRHARLLRNYRNPLEREARKINSMRVAKKALREENQRRDYFHQESVRLATNSEQVAVEQIHFLQLQLKRQIQQTMQRPRLRIDHVHPGLFGPSAVYKVPCWSCCLAENKDARGCEKRVFDLDRWNYDAP